MTVIVDTALSPLLDARTDLATAIETATGYTCHPSHETALATPCYVLEPAGWVTVTPTTVDLADGVEELARLAWVACIDHGCRMIECPPPGAVTVGSHDYAGVQFTTTLLVTIRSI